MISMERYILRCICSKTLKVKSDQINALRKQYDAFLEEDKRRKERNEYILGRLDKMRYCTAIVPLRHKPTLFVERKDNFSTSSSLLQLNKSSLDIPRQFDETTVLHEISKKYILIPKIRPMNEADNISIPPLQPAFEENGDWKSKYEILEQLKKREKKSDASDFPPEFSQQNNYDNVQERDVQKYYDDKIDQPKLTYKYELPEKDKEDKKYTGVQNQHETKIKHSSNALSNKPIAGNHINEPQINPCTVNTQPQNYFEFKNNSEQLETHPYIQNQAESTEQLKTHPYIQNQTKSTEQLVTHNPYIQNQAESTEQLKTHPYIQNQAESSEQLETHHPYIQNQAEFSPTFYPEPAPVAENIENNTQNYPTGNYNERVNSAMVSKQYAPVEEDKDTGHTEKIYPEGIHSEDIQSVEVIHPDDLVKQINDTVPNAASENIETKENYQYPIQTVNVQDFTPGSQVTLQDGVNINPEGYPAELSNAYALENSTPTYEYNRSSEIIEQVENTLDTSGIEAFDAEQREMFYSEGTNENYGYNQDNIVEGYEQELPAQGADYSQADTAVYYEGYDAEQVYPDEIGEHEEANQRYDPNYEQQYATNYSEQEYSQEGYGQQVHTQDPNYAQGDLNQVQEGLEQFQFEQQHEYETVENIEQQLDAEQGYNEQIIMSNIEKPLEELQAKAPQPDSPK